MSEEVQGDRSDWGMEGQTGPGGEPGSMQDPAGLDKRPENEARGESGPELQKQTRHFQQQQVTARIQDTSVF